MTTPECPLCGNPLHLYEIYGSGEWFKSPGCKKCKWRITALFTSAEDAWDAAKDFISLLPIAVRLHYHDELYVDGHPEPVKFIAIQPNTTSLLLVEDSDGKTFWTADHNVDQWPWEEWTGRRAR